jgi:bacteriocin-like protein
MFSMRKQVSVEQIDVQELNEEQLTQISGGCASHHKSHKSHPKHHTSHHKHQHGCKPPVPPTGGCGHPPVPPCGGWGVLLG